MNHDDKGRVQSLSAGVTGMSYNIAGQMTELTLGNGVVESYGYDANRLQLTSQTATKSGNQLMNLTYNYQATAGQMGAGSTAGNAGQLMSINGSINSTTESAAYTYDLLARLVTSDQTSNGSSAQRLFEYDRWGNRTAVYDGLPGGKTPPTQIQSVTFPTTFQQGGSAPTNRIGSVTNNGLPVNYTYDAAGNVTNDGAHSCTYDAENRLVSVDGGATAQYRYDHQNRRVTKIVGSNWTHYVWMGSQVIGEHDATTPYSTNPTYQVQSARKDYIYGGESMIQTRQRSSSTSPWTTRYSLSDRLSVRIMLDTSGNLIGRQAHLPFGEDFGESGTQENHHLASYERDAESGSDYAVNRQYSQITGRFNRSDPLAASGKKGSPQSWNRYAYTKNDPINMRDPLGLDDWGDPCGSRSVVPLEDGWGFNFSYNGPVLSTPPIERWKPFARDPQPEPAPESESSCTLRVETTKGARITDFTPEVGLKFPGGQNKTGPASWGISGGQTIQNGYFWNTYIYAIINDGSGVTRNWIARQEAWGDHRGTFWNGTDPKSAVDRSLTEHRDPDRESPAAVYQFRTADLLAWIDGPGWNPNPQAQQGLRPYDYTFKFSLTSWVELDGKRMCSTNWSLTIKWEKGQLTKWHAY